MLGTVSIENLFIILLLLSGILGCSRSQKDTSFEQFLTYLLNNQGNSVSPCSNYASSENACISSPDSVLLICSESEMNRLTNLIEPPEKRTTEVMSGFWNCWSKCNFLFNSQEAICTRGTKFSSNREYRSATRSGSTSASQAWGICMNSCNKGESKEPGLAGTGATYPKPAY
jgi:hypothetical protein